MNDAPDVEFIQWLSRSEMKPSRSQSLIRTTRKQRGIQGKELAAKMQVSPARVSVLEKDELRGAVTLKMMQKAANALGCIFVYAFVPESSSDQPKPKIRLNSAHMNGDKDRQQHDLKQLYQRSLRKTNND